MATSKQRLVHSAVQCSADELPPQSCAECKLLEAKVSQLESAGRQLGEQVDELEEMENDSRSLAQRLAAQVAHLERELHSSRAQLQLGSEAQAELAFQLESLQFELCQRNERLRALQSQLGELRNIGRAQAQSARAKATEADLESVAKESSVEEEDSLEQPLGSHQDSSSSSGASSGTGASDDESAGGSSERQQGANESVLVRLKAEQVGGSAGEQATGEGGSSGDLCGRSKWRQIATARVLRAMQAQAKVASADAIQRESGHNEQGQAQLAATVPCNEQQQQGKLGAGGEQQLAPMEARTRIELALEAVAELERIGRSTTTSRAERPDRVELAAPATSCERLRALLVQPAAICETRQPDEAAERREPTAATSALSSSSGAACRLAKTKQSAPATGESQAPSGAPPGESVESEACKEQQQLLLQHYKQLADSSGRELAELKLRLEQARTLSDNLIQELGPGQRCSQFERQQPLPSLVSAVETFKGQPQSRVANQHSREMSATIEGQQQRRPFASRRRTTLQAGPPTLATMTTDANNNNNNNFCSSGSEQKARHSASSNDWASQGELLVQLVDELREFLAFLLDKLRLHHGQTFELSNECQRLAMNALIASHTHQLNILLHHQQTVAAGNEATKRAALLALRPANAAPNVAPDCVAPLPMQNEQPGQLKQPPQVAPVLPPPRRRSRMQQAGAAQSNEGGQTEQQSQSALQSTAGKKHQQVSALQVAKQTFFTLVPIYYSRSNKNQQQQQQQQEKSFCGAKKAQNNEAKEARQREDVEAPLAPQLVAGGYIKSVDYCCESDRQVAGGAPSARNSNARLLHDSKPISMGQQMRMQMPAVGCEVQREQQTIATGGRLVVAVGSAPALAGVSQQAEIFYANNGQGYDVATRVAQPRQEQPRVDYAGGVSVLQIDSEKAREGLPAEAATWQTSCERQTHHFDQQQQQQPLSLIAFEHENSAQKQTAKNTFVTAHTTTTLTTTINVSSSSNQPQAFKARPDALVSDDVTVNNSAHRQQQPPRPPPRMINSHDPSGATSTRLAANPSNPYSREPLQQQHHQQQQQQQRHEKPTTCIGRSVQNSLSEDMERFRVHFNSQLLDLLTRQNWCESLITEKLKSIERHFRHQPSDSFDRHDGSYLIEGDLL